MLQKSLKSALFVGSHCAILFSAIAVYSHFWVVAMPLNPPAPVGNVTTVVTYSEGLWKFCEEKKMSSKLEGSLESGEEGLVTMETEECVSLLKPQNVTANFVVLRAVQYTYGSGSIIGVVCVVILYFLFLSEKCLRHNKVLPTVKSMLLMAGGLQLATLILVGSYFMGDSHFAKLDNKYEVTLGWSYIVAIVGDVALFVAASAAALLVGTMSPDEEVPYKELLKV